MRKADNQQAKDPVGCVKEFGVHPGGMRSTEVF